MDCKLLKIDFNEYFCKENIEEENPYSTILAFPEMDLFTGKFSINEKNNKATITYNNYTEELNIADAIKLNINIFLYFEQHEIFRVLYNMSVSSIYISFNESANDIDAIYIFDTASEKNIIEFLTTYFYNKLMSINNSSIIEITSSSYREFNVVAANNKKISSTMFICDYDKLYDVIKHYLSYIKAQDKDTFNIDCIKFLYNFKYNCI